MSCLADRSGATCGGCPGAGSGGCAGPRSAPESASTDGSFRSGLKTGSSDESPAVKRAKLSESSHGKRASVAEQYAGCSFVMFVVFNSVLPVFEHYQREVRQNTSSDAGSKGLPSGAGGYGHAQAGDKTAKPPRIYYATRTHSQIAQVLRLMTVHLRCISARVIKPYRLLMRVLRRPHYRVLPRCRW